MPVTFHHSPCQARSRAALTIDYIFTEKGRKVGISGLLKLMLLCFIWAFASHLKNVLMLTLNTFSIGCSKLSIKQDRPNFIPKQHSNLTSCFLELQTPFPQSRYSLKYWATHFLQNNQSVLSGCNFLSLLSRRTPMTICQFPWHFSSPFSTWHHGTAASRNTFGLLQPQIAFWASIQFFYICFASFLKNFYVKDSSLPKLYMTSRITGCQILVLSFLALWFWTSCYTLYPLMFSSIKSG